MKRGHLSFGALREPASLLVLFLTLRKVFFVFASIPPPPPSFWFHPSVGVATTAGYVCADRVRSCCRSKVRGLHTVPRTAATSRKHCWATGASGLMPTCSDRWAGLCLTVQNVMENKPKKNQHSVLYFPNLHKRDRPNGGMCARGTFFK